MSREIDIHNIAGSKIFMFQIFWAQIIWVRINISCPKSFGFLCNVKDTLQTPSRKRLNMQKHPLNNLQTCSG